MCSAHRHRPLVFCGPSGSGKSTLVNRMMQVFPDTFGFSVSHTTRNPRPGEIDGKHYHFTTKEEMQKSIRGGKFIESATFSGNLYGTSKASVDAVTNKGKICILDIDVQGVKQIMKTTFKPWFIFVEPPSLEELEVRLRARNTETEDSLKQRLKIAEEELIFVNAVRLYLLFLIPWIVVLYLYGCTYPVRITNNFSISINLFKQYCLDVKLRKSTCILVLMKTSIGTYDKY